MPFGLKFAKHLPAIASAFDATGFVRAAGAWTPSRRTRHS